MYPTVWPARTLVAYIVIATVVFYRRQRRVRRRLSLLIGCHTRVRMADLQPVQGELQNQVMAVLWRLERATVEDVRRALPSRHRGAYTTIQTTLQRLYERQLLNRVKEGHAFVYTPVLSEAEYLSLSVEQAFAGASRDARHTALAQLIGGLREDELSEVQRRAREIERKRKKR